MCSSIFSKLLVGGGILFSTCYTSSAQTTTPAAEAPVYTYVEQMPAYPGGQSAMFQLLNQTVFYPTEALKQRLEGKVFVRYVVSAAGTVQNVEVVKGVHPLLDAEAVRAVAKLPAFIPGRQNGRPVAVALTLPLAFKLPANTEQLVAERARPTNGLDEQPAEFPGGPEALLNYLSAVPLPADYQPKAGAQPPRVFVSFVVDSTGQVSNVEAVQPLSSTESRRLRQNPKLAAAPQPLLTAAVNHVQAMPAWAPTKLQGQAASSHLTLPVVFGAPAAAPAYAYAEQMPVFPDKEGLLHYIGRRTRYPVSALRTGTQGTVLLYVEVSEQGTVENVEVIRSVSPALDEEAKRGVLGLPAYTPARHHGKPVRVFYVLPAAFIIK